MFTPADKPGVKPDPLAEAAKKDGVYLRQFKSWKLKGVMIPEVCTGNLIVFTSSRVYSCMFVCCIGVLIQVFAEYIACKPELNCMCFVSQFIPDEVLEYPPHKTIQYHPSLLPRGRGGSAINWTIAHGMLTPLFDLSKRPHAQMHIALTDRLLLLFFV